MFCDVILKKVYRQIKDNSSTENYLISINSLGGRRVMVGLGVGCLWRWMWAGTPTHLTVRGCAGCVLAGRWMTNVCVNAIDTVNLYCTCLMKGVSLDEPAQ